MHPHKCRISPKYELSPLAAAAHQQVVVLNRTTELIPWDIQSGWKEEEGNWKPSSATPTKYSIGFSEMIEKVTHEPHQLLRDHNTGTMNSSELFVENG